MNCISNVRQRAMNTFRDLTCNWWGVSVKIKMSFLTEIFFAFMVDLGNVLQIVSAPGQQIIRPQGSMVMQTVPQTVPASNPSATSAPQPVLPTTQQGDFGNVIMLLSPLVFAVIFPSPIRGHILYDRWHSHQLWVFVIYFFHFFFKAMSFTTNATSSTTKLSTTANTIFQVSILEESCL